MKRMKNTRTGEYRDVNVPSPELAALELEVVDDGQGNSVPAWVVVAETPRRATDDSVHANDITNVGADRHPERNLTEAEIAAGITSWEQKQRELGRFPDQLPTPKSEDEEDSEEELKGETLAELKKRAEEAGLEFSSRVTKAELIEGLTQAELDNTLDEEDDNEDENEEGDED